MVNQAETSFRKCIGDIMRRAVKSGDTAVIRSLTLVFSFLESDYVDYDGFERLFMTEFTSSVEHAMKLHIDEAVVIKYIDKLISDPDDSSSYYALQDYICDCKEAKANQAKAANG